MKERVLKDAHLSLETMAKWLAGDLDPEVLHSQVVPHLLAGCSVCRDRYEEIQRWKQDLGHWDERVAVFEGPEAPALVAELTELPFDEQLGRVADDPRFHTWAVCQVLLRRSLEAAFEEPAQAVNLAELGVFVAQSLGPAYDPSWVLDLQARAEACLGNARRVLGELRSAETAFRRAEAFLAASTTGNQQVLAEILDLKASLRRDQKRPDEALHLLQEAFSLCEEAGDEHALGAVLLKKAKILEERGALAEAVHLLRQATDKIDPGRSERLFVYVRHNLVWTLTTAGYHEEALEMLPKVQELFQRIARPIDFIRLRWAEGRIAAGLGNRGEAEAMFLAVQKDFLRHGMGYDAALVALDLAILYAQERRTAEIKQLSTEIGPVFESREVHREAMAALVLFREACQEERLTVQLASQIAGTLQREWRIRA
jgi:tetratricopeptide (TPR) repeat protein